MIGFIVSGRKTNGSLLLRAALAAVRSEGGGPWSSSVGFNPLKLLSPILRVQGHMGVDEGSSAPLLGSLCLWQVLGTTTKPSPVFKSHT